MSIEFFAEEEVELTPSEQGRECLGNGLHENISCHCEECDFFLDCFPEYEKKETRKRG